MQPLKLKTNKLFYGKWPYKVSTKIQGATLIRSKIKNLDQIRNWCDNPQDTEFLYHSWKNIDRKKLRKFIDILEPCINNGIKLRIESSTVNIFTKDEAVYLGLIHAFKDFVVTVTEPVNAKELNDLLNNNRHVICENYPKGGFRYKVIFRTMPTFVKESLYQWAIKYDKESIYIPKSTKKFMTTARYYDWGDHYFYVKDSGLLMLVTLASQGYIRRTEEFVLRSSINISLDQE